jgi:hypothetical protein
LIFRICGINRLFFAPLFPICGINRVHSALNFRICGINRIRFASIFLRCRISRVRFSLIFTSSGISRFVSLRYENKDKIKASFRLRFDIVAITNRDMKLSTRPHHCCITMGKINLPAVKRRGMANGTCCSVHEAGPSPLPHHRCSKQPYSKKSSTEFFCTRPALSLSLSLHQTYTLRVTVVSSKGSVKSFFTHIL